MLGGRLVDLRKKRKLTQQDIADRLHMTRSTYAQYEIGRRVPDYETLEKLADFFEVSIDYLVGRDTTLMETKKVNNDKEITIKLIEEQAKKLGLSVSDPAFQKMLSDAFDLLRIARGKDL